MSLPTSGGGDEGSPRVVSGVCASALTTAIAALITAGSEVPGTNVILSTGANREFTVVSDGDFVQGVIEDYGYITKTTYWITVRLYGYLDKAGAWWPARLILTHYYYSAPSLGDSILFKSSTQVKSDNAGCGRVISVNTSEETCDIVI